MVAIKMKVEAKENGNRRISVFSLIYSQSDLSSNIRPEVEDERRQQCLAL